ncbi:MAG: energy-coupling factor transporter transmembrane protein EcfT [Epulopiscium sp.]|nr:energy-coupling factor transporter transmembrane protein EcfT [Candidatus Epulonipiscium sp.]
MLRNITIGQYYPVDSYIHNLDPRVKIMGTFVYIISLFLVPNFIGYGIVLLFLWMLIRISKVPFSYIVRGLKSIIMILIFTLGLNVFLTPGEHVLFQWKFIQVTGEGIYIALFMGVRLILLIMGSSLLTLTTSPIQLTDGIENLLSPFKKIGVPSHEIAMMMTIALRFIPILLEETDKIMKAQMARGADFESGGFIKRAKSLIPILIPLFISAFRRADELALAMEARCYRGGENRTRLKQLAMKKEDYKAIVIIGSLVIALVLLRMV